MCTVEASKVGFPRFTAKAEGVCYQGFAVGFGDDLGVCILIAKDKADLLNQWISIIDIEIDLKEVKQVCVFDMEDTVHALKVMKSDDSLTSEESNGTNQTAIVD